MLRGLVLLFSIITLVSCSESEGNVNYDTKDLLGKWNLTNYTYNGKFEISGGPAAIPNTTFAGEGININATTTFTENPNKANAEGSYDIKLTTTSDGDTTTDIHKIGDITSVANWQLNGDILNLANGELVGGNLPNQISSFVNIGNADFKITELNSNSLKLRKSIEQNISQGGITVKINIDIAVDYTK